LAAIAVEVATDRVLNYQPVDAGAVFLFVQRLQVPTLRLRGPGVSGGGAWVNAGLYDAKRLILFAAADQVEARGLAALAPGVDTEGALASLGQVAKGSAMLRDVQALLDQVAAGALTTEQAWAAIDQRIDYNLARLRPLVGPGA
jgi:hypothetical protein